MSGDARKQQIIENQRVLVKHVETGTIRAGTDTLNGPQDVGHFIAPIRKLAQEEMYAIVLDGDNKVINVVKHSKGQKDSATVSPWTLAGAVVATPNAKSVWFAHNHPTGEATPSSADERITYKLNDVLDGTGVVNNGHVVVGKGAELGVMDADGNRLGTTQATPMPRNKTFPVTERQLRMNRTEHQLNDPDSARRIADSVASPNAVILLNTKNQVTGVLPLKDNDLKTLRHPTDNPAAARIMRALDSTNSNQVLLKSTGSPLAMKGMRNLVRFFNRGDSITVLDHLRGKNGEYHSSRELGSDDLHERGAFYALRPEPSARGGVQSGPLRLKMRPLQQRLNHPIHVLQAESELPASLYRRIVADGVQGRVRGLFDPETGATYLIAANLDNVGEATRTVLHELVGHKGVRSLLGNRLDTVLDEIHRDMSDRLKQALGKRYARQTEGMSEADANRLVAEEYLAHLAEKDPQNSLLGKIISMIRNALRRVFPNIKWTDADAVELLAAARQRLKRDGSFNRDGGSRYSDAGRAPTFYSAVERGAAAVKADKMPAQSWLNAIKKGDNVQDEEIQWLGLDLWLDSKKGEKLTRAEVLQYIRENRIDVQEVSYGNTSAETDKRYNELKKEWFDERVDDYRQNPQNYLEIDHLYNEAREEAWQEEFDYYLGDIQDRHASGDLDEYEHDFMVEEDGSLNESRLYDEANFQADESLQTQSGQDIMARVPQTELEQAAQEYFMESGAQEDILDEVAQEGGTKYYSGYSTRGGKNPQELLLTLPEHDVWVDQWVNGGGLIEHRELTSLKQGIVPDSLKLQYNRVGWQVVKKRAHVNDHEKPLTSFHKNREDAIADLIKKAESPARIGQRNYTQSHWDTPNVLAHVRFQTMKDADGNSVLLIDEVQSDWHQQGREEGYNDPRDRAKYKEGNEEVEKIREKRLEYDQLIREKTREQYALKEEIPAKQDEIEREEQGWGELGDTVRIEKLKQELSELEKQDDALTVEIRDLIREDFTLKDKESQLFDSGRANFGIDYLPPTAPFKESWPNLIMKRMIRHAAENGFDRIAWTPTDEQLKRYPYLGRKIKRLEVIPEFAPGKGIEIYRLRIQGPDGEVLPASTGESLLEDYVGNQLATTIRGEMEELRQKVERQRAKFKVERLAPDVEFWRIRDPNGQVVRDRFAEEAVFETEQQAKNQLDIEALRNHGEKLTLDNLDVTVGEGAKGMQAFYDKRLVNYMKKYSKKWGAKVKPVKLEVTPGLNVAETGFQSFWSVLITDAMRDSVLKNGQPLFALKDRKPDTRQADGPRYALKGVPDDVSKVIDQVHGGGKAQTTTQRLKSLWHDKSLLDHIKRGQLHVNQGVFNKAAIIEHNEKLLNEGKLLDASESASKAFHLARNLDYVHEAMLWGGGPQLKNGSVVIKEGSLGLLNILKAVAERDELKLWETWAASFRAKRLLEEDRAARAKGAQLLDRAKALKATLDAVAPEQYPGGRAGYERDRKQMLADRKQGQALSKQNRENLFDDRMINTIQNWVNTQPQLKARFEQVQKDYQKFNSDMLDFMVDAGLIDKDVRKLWNTDDYIPFHRVHDLEATEQTPRDGGNPTKRRERDWGAGGRTRKGLSNQNSGIKRLTSGVEQIAPLEAMVRNTRSMLDAAFKNIAMQRIVGDAEQLGALERVDFLDKITDDDVVARLEELGMDTNLTPEQKRRWKALMGRYTEMGEGTVSASVNGRQQVYLVHDPLLLSTIRDLGQPAFITLMKLVGIPRKLLTTFVTAMPDFMVRNLMRDTISTAVHIAPEVNGKAVTLNPIAGAVRGFRKSLDKDPARLAMMMGGGGGGGYYDVTAGNVRKMLSPDEQKRLLNHPARLWQLWQRVGSRFENSNRLHVYEQTRKAGGSEAEAAYQAMDVMNFTRSGRWCSLWCRRSRSLTACCRASTGCGGVSSPVMKWPCRPFQGR